jgi:hypothetical protein
LAMASTVNPVLEPACRQGNHLRPMVDLLERVDADPGMQVPADEEGAGLNDERVESGTLSQAGIAPRSAGLTPAGCRARGAPVRPSTRRRRALDLRVRGSVPRAG